MKIRSGVVEGLKQLLVCYDVWNCETQRELEIYRQAKGLLKSIQKGVKEKEVLIYEIKK